MFDYIEMFYNPVRKQVRNGMPPTLSPFSMPPGKRSLSAAHVLTDRGSCFTADDFERTCAKIKVCHRKTKSYTPQTNGMVERFNGRIASEALGINVAGHADLEILLVGFNGAYNRRP